MDLLDQEEFDFKLIKLIKEWLGEKSNQAVLVFDGRDPLGDKHSEGNLTIVYTPKDDFYDSADEKLIEIVNNFIAGNRFAFRPDDNPDMVTVITDDAGIVKKLAGALEDCPNRLFIKSAQVFADEIQKKLGNNLSDEQEEDDKNLDEEDVDKINSELLKIWQK